MKKQRWVFFGMCSLVLGIVLFCVVFGGYSSLLRSQNRIAAAFDLTLVQVRHHYSLNQKLLVLIQSGATGPEVETRARELTQIQKQMDDLSSVRHPLTPSDEETFMAVCTTLNRHLGQLSTMALPDNLPKHQELLPRTLEAQRTQLHQGLLQTTVRYNKEATYFNQRRQVVPVRYIARMFSLDHLSYPLLPLDSLKQLSDRG